MTRWRVPWEHSVADEWLTAHMDVPGGEFGKHGARVAAQDLVQDGRLNIRVQKSEDGVELVEG